MHSGSHDDLTDPVGPLKFWFCPTSRTGPGFLVLQGGPIQVLVLWHNFSSKMSHESGPDPSPGGPDLVLIRWFCCSVWIQMVLPSGSRWFRSDGAAPAGSAPPQRAAFQQDAGPLRL